MKRSIVLVTLLALLVGTSPASAQPRTRGKHPVATSRSRPTRAAVRTKRPPRPAPRAALRPAKRQDAAPRVMIAGAVRGPSEPRGRMDAVALTPAERTADALDAILRGPLRFGTTGLYVVDAATGAELFAIHPDDPLNPASNVKLIATATALDQVGPAFRYTTRLLGARPDADGAVAGDVYLHGSFDPTLAVGGLDDLAGQVAAAGVRAIHGDVVVGEQATRDGIYRARLHVEVAAAAPGAAPTVAVGPASDFLEIVNRATTSKRAKVKKKAGISVTTALVDRGGHKRLQVIVAGTIGKGKTSAHFLSTKERHLYAAHLLRAALAKAGVTVDGDVHVAPLADYVTAATARGVLPVPLGAHRSAPLADIVAQVNKRSINWLADRVLTTTTALARGELPSMADGVDAMYGWLERTSGIGRKDAVVDTGSGLSYRTELSPRQLVAVVRVATGAAAPTDPTQAACADAFRRSLSVAGVDGTLRGRFRSSLRGRVVAKTGTLTGVIALSGLLDGPDGRTLAFSLVTNGHSQGRKPAVRAAHEQVLAELDRYLAATAPAAPAVEPAEPATAIAGAAAPVSEIDTADDGLADDAAPATP
ncbi:MAG: D-alanyl-D-alanine carboxypeptidase/D-alanyl-D-alanine-endopeptidase [Myxococcales bacterium]|nr:D-alanyl-D-alanine carboxypeptidase/D-alanyl-D-alanine-endopeptidase [Myxococcales bacterium]MBK7198756.1 D-alanyl-D-alanine carboxypeptidase/D-alanyl-D-alanine-endopeptidase [Myxococcales bacterium]MBP6845358.1 D-alanyl-D-alanine carboxypeptidase/D-alanyl-D-alanine-endopeptidase [Kofleriaceae bacterium]